MSTISSTFLAGAVVLAVSAGSAKAFSEVETAPVAPGTGVTDAPAELQAAPGTPVQNDLPALQLIDPNASGSSDSGGTPLSLPGIGYIGTLPKLDFGLELLYSAPDADRFEMNEMPPSTETPSKANEDDVIIRGTLKHRF